MSKSKSKTIKIYPQHTSALFDLIITTLNEYIEYSSTHCIVEDICDIVNYLELLYLAGFKADARCYKKAIRKAIKESDEASEDIKDAIDELKKCDFKDLS